MIYAISFFSSIIKALISHYACAKSVLIHALHWRSTFCPACQHPSQHPQKLCSYRQILSVYHTFLIYLHLFGVWLLKGMVYALQPLPSWSAILAKKQQVKSGLHLMLTPFMWLVTFARRSHWPQLSSRASVGKRESKWLRRNSCRYY